MAKRKRKSKRSSKRGGFYLPDRIFGWLHATGALLGIAIGILILCLAFGVSISQLNDQKQLPDLTWTTGMWGIPIGAAVVIICFLLWLYARALSRGHKWAYLICFFLQLFSLGGVWVTDPHGKMTVFHPGYGISLCTVAYCALRLFKVFGPELN